MSKADCPSSGSRESVKAATLYNASDEASRVADHDLSFNRLGHDASVNRAPGHRAPLDHGLLLHDRTAANHRRPICSEFRGFPCEYPIWGIMPVV